MYPVAIHGRTIQIREIRSDDAAAIARIIGEPEVLRFTTWKGPADLDAAEQFVRAAQETAAATPRIEYTLAIVARDSGEVVGTGGIRIEDQTGRVGSLRCLLHPDWWHRGIATDTARLAIAFGFGTLSLHRIEAEAALDNLAANSVLEKAAFRRNAIRPRHHLAPDGQLRDSVGYAVDREDWAAAERDR